MPILERARLLLGARVDSRLFVCGFSQGAFAAVEYAGANVGAVTAWVGVDAARRVPVERHRRSIGRADAAPSPRRAGRLPPQRAAPDDLLARDEIQLADLSHVAMCREVYSGRFRLDNGDSVYDWLLRQGSDWAYPLADAEGCSRPSRIASTRARARLASLDAVSA